MSELTQEQKRIFEIMTKKPLWMSKKNVALTKRGWVDVDKNELLIGKKLPQWVLDHLNSINTEESPTAETNALADSEVDVSSEDSSSSEPKKRGRKPKVETINETNEVVK